MEEVAGGGGGGGGGGGVEKMWRRGEEMEEGGEGERKEKGRGEVEGEVEERRRKGKREGEGGWRDSIFRIPPNNSVAHPWHWCATEFFSLFLIFFILLGKFFCWP